jgi:uncharacterized membrane protein YdjX (TVP38/TMEM64 family)
MKLTPKNVGKIVAACIWFSLLLSVFFWMEVHQVTLRELPRVLRTIVRHQGSFGPVVIVLLYVLRSFLFLPASVLTIVAGTLFGPWWGSLLNILGENISASVSFFIGRLFGRRFVQAHEAAWLKKYDELLTKDGFLPILLMRFLLFPFDVVNIGSGMTGIPYRIYVLATFLGMIPAIITFTVLGNVANQPRSLIVFFVLVTLILLAVWILQRIPAVRRRLGLHLPLHE